MRTAGFMVYTFLAIVFLGAAFFANGVNNADTSAGLPRISFLFFLLLAGCLIRAIFIARKKEN
jgi:hypothetical protein